MATFEMLNGMDGVQPVVTREGESKGVSVLKAFLPLLSLGDQLVGWVVRDPEEGDRFYCPIMNKWTNPPRDCTLKA